MPVEKKNNRTHARISLNSRSLLQLQPGKYNEQ